MTRGTQELKQEIHKGRQLLETLFDEIQVKLHLAGMDARDAWKVLRADAEKASREATDASRGAFDDIVERVRAFSKAMKSPPAKSS